MQEINFSLLLGVEPQQIRIFVCRVISFSEATKINQRAFLSKAKNRKKPNN